MCFKQFLRIPAQVPKRGLGSIFCITGDISKFSDQKKIKSVKKVSVRVKSTFYICSEGRKNQTKKTPNLPITTHPPPPKNTEQMNKPKKERHVLQQ